MNVNRERHIFYLKGRAEQTGPPAFFQSRRLFKRGEICSGALSVRPRLQCCVPGRFRLFRGAGQRLQVAEAVCMEKAVFPKFPSARFCRQAAQRKAGEQRRRSRGRRIFFERRSGFPRTARQARHNRGSAPRPPARRLAAAPPAAAGDGRIPARIGAEGGQSEAQAAAVCASLSASYDAQVIVRKLRGHVLKRCRSANCRFRPK